jgi:RimJ/RimL family protein N-acetyltransferase
MTDFSLRAWNPRDVGSLLKYADNSKIARNLTDKFPHPYTRQDGVNFISMASSFDPPRIFAIDIECEAVGSIGIFPQEDVHRLNAEMGYWLAEPFWGLGIISRAIPQIVEYGFKTWDIRRIFARPYGTNLASQRVLEKNGFVLEARFSETLIKNGELLDELIYAIRR